MKRLKTIVKLTSFCLLKIYVSFALFSVLAAHAAFRVMDPATPIQPQGNAFNSRPFWAGLCVMSSLWAISYALDYALLNVVNREKEERIKNIQRVMEEQDVSSN